MSHPSRNVHHVMLHLHHADQLDPLLDALAAVLDPAPADPFTPDLVVVPAVGLGDVAMAGLGRRLGATGYGDGIAANIEFVFPGQFMARALGDSSAEGPAGDPWRLPQLTWWVLDELAATTVRVPGRSDSGVGWWSLARRIADLFDRYATQRPRLIQEWARGLYTDGTADPEGAPCALDMQHRWQADLWRGVRARIGTPSPPERLPHLLAAILSGEVQPALPQRVALFGVGGIPPAMLGVLRSLGAARDVHVFLRHPSHVAWASSPHALAGSLSSRAHLDVTAHISHPLLPSWGRPALEARALVGGAADVFEHAEGVVPHSPPTTLLAALQSGIRRDERPHRQVGIHPADGSIQVHACHGMARQLEALRDALGHAFVADPTLAPHEVLVLCPDLDRTAPLVEAVFGRGTLPIPVRIGDRSLTTDDPMVGALQSVLALVSGRATLSEVLALVQFEPVRRRFGWTIDDVEQLADWCTRLGTRWGLAADHRPEWHVPGTITTGTWRYMVDQLLAGIAMPAPVPRVAFGGVAPFDDIGSDSLALVGGVAELIARLVDLHSSAHSAQPITAWVDLLHGVLETFTAVEPTESWRRQAVHRQLDTVAASAQATHEGSNSAAVLLTLTDVRAVLADSLHDRPGRLPLRSGAVTVSSLIPQHGVPARVICLVGLDDGTLRGGAFDGDDALGSRPCIGERHPRFEGRQLLLDAVLAAREKLIITCDGADLTTNKETPLVVPLVELLDVIGHLTELRAHGEPVVVRHPRHGFNERSLIPGALWEVAPGPFTFDASMLSAAEARRSEEMSYKPDHERSSVASPWLLRPVRITDILLDDLIVTVRSPARVYLEDRLDIRLPAEGSELDDNLAVSVEPLDEARLGGALLSARRQGIHPDEWEAATRLDGSLPPAELGSSVMTSVRTEVGRMEAAAAKFGVSLTGAAEALIELSLPFVAPDGTSGELTISGLLGGIITADPSVPLLSSIRFARPRPSFRLGLAVQLAALQYQQPDAACTAVLIARGKKAEAVNPTAFRLTIKGEGFERRSNAAKFLHRVGELRWWALRDAVPFFDKTSHLLHLDTPRDLAKAIEYDLLDASTATLWPDLSLDLLSQESVAASDPPLVATIAGANPGMRRAAAVASWVWGVYDETILAKDETIRLGKWS